MKLLALTRLRDEAIAAPPAMWLAPDSALVLPGRPLFLPDFADEWRMELLPAVRISRLGKSISERFTMRYFDAMSLIMRLVPVDLERMLKENGAPQSLATAFDNCVQMGQWIQIEEGGLPEMIHIDINGTKIEIGREELGVEAAISALSQYISLRTGDVVCPLTIPLEMEVAVGSTFTAGIGDEMCLSARIK